MLNNNKIAAKQVCFSKFSITFAKRIKWINDERYKSNKSRVGYQYVTTDLYYLKTKDYGKDKS